MLYYFWVAVPATELGLYEAENALWAEAKAGVRKDIHESFVQLILTIGRARTFDTERPPLFLGAFDAEKIAFLPYNAVQDVFTQNDFNWNVAPSNHESKEFAQLHALAERTIADQALLFDFVRDETELRRFIKANFKIGRTDVSRIQIDKNNFTHIYRKWREAVLPPIRAIRVIRGLNSPRRRVPFLTRGASSGGTTMRSPARIRMPRTTTSAGISRG